MGSQNITKVLSQPIAASEFANAFLSIWKPSKQFAGLTRNHGAEGGTRKLGLAISGGVDSMALALLCTKIRDQNEGSKAFQLKAFIVDHNVRKGSDTEAQNVSKILEKLGIRSQVLRIDWGAVQDPGKQANFESLARKFRYTVLGQACREYGTDSLLLAHHEDDQAETIMVRLAHGKNAFGLSGMKRVSGIPECHGIYGLHQSGAALKVPGWEGTSAKLAIEGGGVKIYRPLLGFSKSRLIATCESEDVKWFEDHTNKDPTLTVRNAVRHMVRSHQLPAALTTPSLLRLSESCALRLDNLEQAAAEALKTCTMKNLDTRMGTLTIQFPSNLSNSISRTYSPADLHLIAGYLLRQVLMIITPLKAISITALHGSVQRCFPSLYPHEPDAHPSTFTVAGVQLQPVPTSPGTWLLSRQPTSSANVPTSRAYLPSSTWSDWELYDGRFWFRILNASPHPLFIKPLTPQDWAIFRRMRRGSTRLLRDMGLGSAKWTLPALTVRDADGEEIVVALPTMRLSMPGFGDSVQWQVRYKHIDVESLPPVEEESAGTPFGTPKGRAIYHLPM